MCTATQMRLLLIAAMTTTLFTAGPLDAQTTMPVGTNWPSYAGDNTSAKYSPLAQIDAGNFARLRPAWTWRSPEEEITKANPDLKTWAWEATPLIVDGVMFVSTSYSQVAAIDAATGQTKWTYDPGTWKEGTISNNGFVHRGVAYWSDGADRRVLLGTGDGYMICLNAETGEPVASFGENGRVDLTARLGRPVSRKLYGVSSPPVICRDVVVMGSRVHDFPLIDKMPPGDVRGFDVRTGKQLWIFHTVAQAGEVGNDTWQRDSWKTTGAANVWTMMSADDALGYVYLPTGTSASDYYGGARPGDGLFGDSLVCVDVTTGKRVWHFQMAHHGLWDYDLPCAPNLIDVNVGGKPIKAVAQLSKQGFCYVFDRATGKPVWPIEERAVPQSTIPGEHSSPTQPFPTKPAAFDIQNVTPDSLVDFTPELRRKAMAILEQYHYGPVFTPPSLDKPTIQLPGNAGGASWSGGAVDPETGTLYVSSITMPNAVTMAKSSEAAADYVGQPGAVDSIDGVPIWKPPYGRVTAIDLNTGEFRWITPVGNLGRTNALLQPLNLPPTGRPARGHLLVTKTLLIVAQEGSTTRGKGNPRGYVPAPDFNIVDPSICAFDKATGKLVGEVKLPRNATAAPMTYELNGKQYLAVATGGANLPAELIVLALP